MLLLEMSVDELNATIDATKFGTILNFSFNIIIYILRQVKKKNADSNDDSSTHLDW